MQWKNCTSHTNIERDLMVSPEENGVERTIHLAGDSNLSNSQKKLRRIKQKKLIRLENKGLRTFKLGDVNKLSEFQLLRLAIFNGFFKNRRNTTGQINESILREFLRDEIQSGKKIQFVVPKKMRKKSIDALVAEIPFRNLLLWCDAIEKDDYKNAALHLWVAVKECEDIEPDAKIIHLVGRSCKEGGCNGYYHAWNFSE